MDMTLADLNEGDRAKIISIKTCITMRRRLFDLGLIEGTEVMCLHKSPFGDPVAFFIRGTVLALRLTDMKNIFIIQ